MKRLLFISIFLSVIFLAGCQNNVTASTEAKGSYPKLKVENKTTTTNYVIFSVKLPNNDISPVEIDKGESATFELINGMFYYDNVTVRLEYGVSRNASSYRYYKANFVDGKTTVITFQ